MTGYEGPVRRDRYGEPIDDDDQDLELVAWEGPVAHHLRVAREVLPPREPPPELTQRREGLKTRLAAARRSPWR